MKDTKFYITTPIYYVNDKPHIGHAYTTILADVLARYHRLMGIPTHFLTGTDEHGQKVQTAAAIHNISPLQHCDETVVHFQNLWKRLGITNDDFIRTTQERHKRVVSQCLQSLYDQQLIYDSTYKGWYCVGDERFYTEKDLVDGKCPDCGRTVTQIEEKCYKFKMSLYQDRLIQYINDNPDFIQPEHFRRETLGFLSKPLDDLCISRPKSRLSWGIELPFDKEYVTYVWFDALVNYISAVGYLYDDVMFKKWWPANYHLIGKDILTTHTVYWPTMLMAMGIPLPHTVFAHGWWLTGDKKMSKSLHNVVNPMDMIDKYGVDAFRYYLIAAMSLGQDANFCEILFIKRYNAELANDLGNFISRALTMLQRFNGGIIPDVNCNDNDNAASAELRRETLNAVTQMPDAIDNMKLDSALNSVMNAVRAANRYWTEQAPWTLAKEGKKDELAHVIKNSLECLRIVSGLLFPVMPDKMTTLRKCLGLSDDAIAPNFHALSQWNQLTPGTQTALPPPLFPRVQLTPEQSHACESCSGCGKDKDKDKGKQQPRTENGPAAKTAAPKTPKEDTPPAVIGIEDFAKLKLQSAVVIAAEHVADADRLLRLQIQIGDETRQIVSGIAQWYKPEELVGKSIVVLSNLKPALIRGVESKGMLLAAKAGKTLRLVTVDGDIPSGSSIG